MKEVWVVETRVRDQNPAYYGPYTRLQAERLERQLNDEVTLATDKFGIVHHPFDVEYAVSTPLSRYDNALDSAGRRQLFEFVKAENERPRGDDGIDRTLGHLEV